MRCGYPSEKRAVLAVPPEVLLNTTGISCSGVECGWAVNTRGQSVDDKADFSAYGGLGLLVRQH